MQVQCGSVGFRKIRYRRSHTFPEVISWSIQPARPWPCGRRYPLSATATQARTSHGECSDMNQAPQPGSKGHLAIIAGCTVYELEEGFLDRIFSILRGSQQTSGLSEGAIGMSSHQVFHHYGGAIAAKGHVELLIGTGKH